MHRSLLSGVLASTLLLAAPALAAPPAPDQAVPAAAATAAPVEADRHDFGGPLVPGVCLLSREQVFARSKIGQAAAARLKQLGLKAQANLEAEKRKLEAEAKAFQTQQATMQPAQAQHRQQQLQARFQAIQANAAQINREMEATRTKATGLVEEAFEPVVKTAYQAKGCGLLISREAVVGGNLGNDLTEAVVQGLDAKATTITFEREHLPPAPAEGAR
jgi:Skp family chaperone for outer membrane proteins